MNRKYIFFDIDGTLTDANPGGKVLESTFKTFDQLRKNGHFVSIATGRAQWMAMPFAKETNILNLVTDGGNGITINGEVKHIHPLDFEAANKVIDVCKEKGFPYGVSLDNVPILHTTKEMENYPMNMTLSVHDEFDFRSQKAIYKIFINLSREEEKLLDLTYLDHMRYFEGELIIEPAEKYKGICEMVDMLGGDKDDIVVFGDGLNDVSMIKNAPLGIAMGNGCKEVLEVADFITKRNDEDGIEYACRHFGWI